MDGRWLGFTIQRSGFRTHTLYLFTTLTDAALYPAAELLAPHYGENARKHPRVWKIFFCFPAGMCFRHGP